MAASKRPGRSEAAPEKAPRAWPKSSLSRRFSGRAAPLMATNGPPARRGALVDHAREDLLADAALAREEDGRVDARDAAGEVEGAPHPGAPRDDARVLLLDLQPRQLAPARLQLRLGRAEGVADPGELPFEAALREARERHAASPRPTPPPARPPSGRSASPFPTQRLLDDADRPPVDDGEVAAREAGQRPADRLVGEAEVEEVLLGLVRILPDRLRRSAAEASPPRAGSGGT